MQVNIPEIVKSKKFQAFIISVATVWVNVYKGTITPAEGVDYTVKAAAVYMGAQGLADFGKSKAQVEKPA